MTEDPTDALWPHFAPLWSDLRRVAPGVRLAGGYALFLKQKWLLSPAGSTTPTLVSVFDWNEQTPRVTKDLDFIVAVDLIASHENQDRMQSALDKHGFTVVPENARWQFEKPLDAQRSVVVDFHAPSPVERRMDVRVESRRVKPNPSLGQTGIHGRENAETIGCEFHPFSFVLDGVEIALLNPVTTAFMKLGAMRDRRLAAQDDRKSAPDRTAEEEQARKHALDLFRLTAMITRKERDQASDVLAAARAEGVYSEGATTFRELFGGTSAWGTRVVTDMWKGDDLRLIQRTLSGWFG